MNETNHWWQQAVIYEVYVDKFASDFRGMIDKLPYLKNLGINCIWLLPHYSSPMIDDGYDVSDYMKVRKELGTLEDFKIFVEKAHGLGIRVIVDLVLNHVSIDHPWFKNATKSSVSKYRDYFLWSKTGKEFLQAVNPFSHTKPSNWVFDKNIGEYYFATFYPQQVDLNWDNPEVFDEMMKITDFWVDNGIDGFRLDAVPFLIKREGTTCVNLSETHQLIKKIRSHVESKNTGVILLAEANGSSNEVKEYFGNGDECHMAFNFHLMSKMFLALKRGDNSIAEKTAHETADIPKNCQWATFLRNHDELTFEHVEDEERKELLSWLDTDKMYSFEGRGVSMRLATIFAGDKEKILEAFKLLFSLPGSPVIYYGDEIGMKNLEYQEKPLDSRKYVRGEFDWTEAERQVKDSNSLLGRLSILIKVR